MLERLVQQMIGLQPNPQGIEEPLDPADRRHRASHVFQQKEAPVRSEHAPYLLNGVAVVGNCAQRWRADDRVEAPVGQVKRLSVAYTKINGAAALLRSPSRDLCHLRAQFDRGEGTTSGG